MSEKEFINKLKELNSPAALWYCFANVYKAYQTEPNELFKAIDDAKIYQDTLNEILCGDIKNINIHFNLFMLNINILIYDCLNN